MKKVQFNKFTFILLCLWCVSVNGQTATVTIEEMGNVFQKNNDIFLNTQNYRLTVTHASYETYTSELPVEKQTGTFRKDGKNYHSELLGIRTIQNENYKIVIDTATKVILVANPDQLTWTAYTKEDYNFLLKRCTSIRMSKTGRYTFYRMELPENSPIGAYEFLVDENGMTREVNWYYNKEVKKDENDENSKVKPKMSISFSGFKDKIDYNYQDTFSEQPYFTKKDNKLIPTEKYRMYKLMDQRIRK